MRLILFFVVLIGMIFLFATIRSGIRDGATLTLKVILSELGFIALLLFLFALAACRTTPCKMPHRPRILRA
ncbi:hypothetical protein [Thauera phenylacetica]